LASTKSIFTWCSPGGSPPMSTVLFASELIEMRRGLADHQGSQSWLFVSERDGQFTRQVGGVACDDGAASASPPNRTRSRR
jgi:hypothetical protein